MCRWRSWSWSWSIVDVFRFIWIATLILFVVINVSVILRMNFVANFVFGFIIWSGDPCKYFMRYWRFHFDINLGVNMFLSIVLSSI